MSSPESTTPEGVPAEGSILSKVVMTEGALKAQARARELIKQANLSEAIRIIEQLEGEVAGIVMPTRFSRTKKPSESPYQMGGALNPILSGLTEDEYKRQVLLIDLREIKNRIVLAISSLEDVVMDIEATKQEG